MIVQSDSLHELEKILIPDAKTGVLRMAWILRFRCDICQRRMKKMFFENPSETRILEVVLCPCQKCIDKIAEGPLPSCEEI